MKTSITNNDGSSGNAECIYGRAAGFRNYSPGSGSYAGFCYTYGLAWGIRLICIMQRVVVGYEDSPDIVQRFYQGGSFVQPEPETGCAQGITVHRGAGDDCDLKELVVVGIAGGGIQQVVIDFTVFLEIPFIGAGGDHRLPVDFYGRDGLVCLSEGLLDSDMEGLPVIPSADCNDVAAETDKCVLNSLLCKIGF